MNYRIAEIFYSIQSEGYNSGMPAVFIRFYGCNLKCNFCDEKDKRIFKEYDIKDLIIELKKYVCKNIILTGGEPSLQIDALLLNNLKNEGYKIFIETNGSLKINEKYKRFIDWITVSPKFNIINQIDCNEVKIVYDGQSLNELEDILNKFNCRNIFLQPKSNNKKYIEQAISILRNRNDWRLSIQWHKLIDIK